MRGVLIYRRRLPHWRLDGATYFVTWRLHRSQPGLTHEERGRLFDVLRYADSRSFTMHAAVVMDDHIHVVVTPKDDAQLEGLVCTWKACGVARLRRSGRVAPFWQREYHDRLVRNEAELQQKVRYVIDNPLRRWPGIVSYPWLFVHRDIE